MEGRSSLASFGITQFPLGTYEEVKAAGFDVKDVASCGEERPGVRICPFDKACQFHLKSMGGFKHTQGPRYVGFRIINPADGTATQDICKCHTWVQTLQARADAGAAERRVSNGRRGEVIRVIAQQGDTITTRFNLPVNGKGQVINPMPEIVEILKANEVPHSLLPSEVAVAWKFFELKRQVPRHPRPGELQGDSYAHRVAMLDIENEARDREYVQYGSTQDKEEEAQALGSPLAEPVTKVRNPYGRAGKPKDADA